MNYKETDFSHIWHPFTQATQWFERDPLIVSKAEGFYLYDREGRKYLDGVSSLWCNVHGHSHPEFVKAGKDQVEKLCHSTILGASHEPIIEATKRLVEIAPKHLTRVFYSDSGTSAVEAAIRIALESCQKTGKARKTKLVSLAGAYHGDTLGAVGIGFLDFFHGPLKSSVVESHRVNPPHVFRYYEGMSEEEALEKSIKELEKFFSEKAKELAAFFVEPIVQGAAGIWIHQENYLAKISELCKANDVLLIVDEVATGFYKTGSLFSHQLAKIEPDMMVLGKGLSGGMLPISCVLAREELFESFSGRPSEGKTFFYGQTFAGNPLAARFQEVNLRLIADGEPEAGLDKRIETFGNLITDKISTLPHVEEVRRKGLMTAIELTSKPGERSPYGADEEIGVKIVQAGKELGLFIRPLGNAMILMPAPSMPEPEIKFLVEATAQAIQTVTEG